MFLTDIKLSSIIQKFQFDSDPCHKAGANIENWKIFGLIELLAEFYELPMLEEQVYIRTIRIGASHFMKKNVDHVDPFLTGSEGQRWSP